MQFAICCVQESTLHNTDKSIRVSLVGAYHKTAGCCLFFSLDESLIIKSSQLNKSLWTPCRAGHLNFKAQRSLFSVPCQCTPCRSGIGIHMDVLRFMGPSHIKAFSHSTLHFSSENGHQIDSSYQWHSS